MHFNDRPGLLAQGPGTVSELITQHVQSQSAPASVHLLGSCTSGGDSASEASASAVQSLLSNAADGTQVTSTAHVPAEVGRRL